MIGTQDARQVLRWGLRHGVMRAMLLRRARSGDVGARLMIDPALRDDPYPSYEQLRARGRLVATGLAPTSVDHALCTAVLRSPDFGSGVRSPDELSPPVRLAMRLAAGRPAGRGRAAVHARRGPPGPHALPQARHPRASAHAGSPR